MRIGDREIGPGHPPYLIAEMSGEHRGNIQNAYQLLDAAKEAGAGAVKLQLFSPEKLAEARGGKGKVLTEGLWAGRGLLELYQETHTPREWFPDLFAYAKNEGITLFSSVFDEDGVDYLETLGCPAYKIASFEIRNLALIRKAASTGKPLIISTGMASHPEIVTAINETAVKELDADYCGMQWKVKERCALAILHCVSSYPCKIGDANLMRIAELRAEMSPVVGLVVGLSDHTLGTTAAVVAAALGASIIEKHITLSRSNGGPDATFSLEPEEFKKLVGDVRDAWASLGRGGRPASEEMYRGLRHKGTS